MNAPSDLHQLLATLGPENGWRMRHLPGIWRPIGNGGQFIEPDGPGMVLIHGSLTSSPETTFFHRLTLAEVVPWLKSKGEA